MPQMTLYAPDITCDHCIATIQKTSTAIEGVRFIDGDPDTRSFRLDVPSGVALDALAVALADEGYPLGGPDDAPTGGGMPAMAGHGANVTMLPMAGATKPKFVPTYTPKPSAAGADVVYSCPCGSTTEVFHYDRSKAEQTPHACCNHQVLVAPDAAQRLRALDGYEVINVQTVTMPWGQPMEAAMAVRP
ncbi:MAG: copper chaperone [Dehalococcoidia bacterium]|nr:MAG: copper chaperone [Dehalococcoidia bacterium]